LVKQFEINFPIQRQGYSYLDLVLQIYEQKIKVMNCIKLMIELNHMLKTIIKFTYERKSRNTWKQIL